MELRLIDIPDREFEVLHAAVLRLLYEYGMLFEHREANEILVRAGNELDHGGRVHLRPAFVEAALEKVPAEGFALYGRDEEKVCRVAIDAIAFRPATGMPFIIDYQTRQRRPATMADARVMARLTDALENFDLVNSVVNPAEAPGQQANFQRFVNAHRHSLKPSDITVATGREVEAVARAAAAIRGSERQLREKPLTAVDVSVVSPLRCTRDDTDALLACARHGLPIEILTSPSLGISSPITMAGGVAVSLAEMIGALCLVYEIAPGLGLINTSRVQPVDMRTAAVNYGAPELGMASVVMAACSARYRLPGNLYGLGSVARSAGMQAVMEKTLGGLLMSLGRVHMVTGPGLLDNALVTSPEVLVIDHELSRFLERVREPIAIDEETIGVDTIMRAMEESGSLIAEAHTIEHLREGALFECGLNQWSSLEEWTAAGQPDLFERAHEKVEEILATHLVPPFEPGVERELKRIEEEF